MVHTKPIFNLFLTREEALVGAKEYLSNHESEGLHLWEDPHDCYNQRMMFKLDGIFANSFDADIAEFLIPGEIDPEARAALIWLIDRHKGFNPLELGQVIVGIVNYGIEGDREVAIFTYLSREDDCLRDFISEKAYDLVNKK